MQCTGSSKYQLMITSIVDCTYVSLSFVDISHITRFTPISYTLFTNFCHIAASPRPRLCCLILASKIFQSQLRLPRPRLDLELSALCLVPRLILEETASSRPTSMPPSLMAVRVRLVKNWLYYSHQQLTRCSYTTDQMRLVRDAVCTLYSVL